MLLAVLGFSIMSKTVTSVPVSAVQSALTGRRKSSHTVGTVFAIPPVEAIPKQLTGVLEKLATKQVRQVVGAHESKGELGSGSVIIVSSRGIVQIFRKNSDGSVGQLIVEAAAYPESDGE